MFSDYLYACGDQHDAGEEAHWTPFQIASVNYIREKYPDWATQDRLEDGPGLVAFTMVRFQFSCFPVFVLITLTWFSVVLIFSCLFASLAYLIHLSCIYSNISLRNTGVYTGRE